MAVTVVQGRDEYLDRLVAGLEEQRQDLGLSRRQLGELAGLASETVRNVERGQTRNPNTVLRLRVALTMVELTAPPKLEDDVAVLSPLAQPSRVGLLGRPRDEWVGSTQPVWRTQRGDTA